MFVQDCEHDMGLTAQDMTDLQNGWATMMNRTQAKVLEKGGFDWRMFRPGAGTCDGPPFPPGKDALGETYCASYMRSECRCNFEQKMMTFPLKNDDFPLKKLIS